MRVKQAITGADRGRGNRGPISPPSKNIELWVFAHIHVKPSGHTTIIIMQYYMYCMHTISINHACINEFLFVRERLNATGRLCILLLPLCQTGRTGAAYNTNSVSIRCLYVVALIRAKHPYCQHNRTLQSKIISVTMLKVRGRMHGN